MTISVASLERKSAARLRAFVEAQRVRVERNPDRVEEPGAAGKPFPSSPFKTYWRYLVRRVPLEGVCVYYQTYDAGGDENDWNLNIAPDPAYRWMLDREILYALSLVSEAPGPIDLSEIKVKEGSQVIECETSPDDGLFDKFTVDGLPISEGSWWPNENENQGQGPDEQQVGVYGVFCGDYGHGGRPEIHPFDAFWRRCHLDGGSDTISWELGVFQDDSNRFNNDWSKAPIEVEFRVPFCLDVPVTLRAATATRARFVLQQSDLCRVVGKNTRGVGSADLTETFTARTVRFNPGLENRLEVTVEDRTGLAGRPFSLSFGDLSYTTSSRFGLLSQRAWLAGHIVIRVAVDQDGFAYWNLSGPNSQTAAEAQDDDGVVTDPDVVLRVRAGQRAPRPRRTPVKVADARAVVTAGRSPRISAEIKVGPPGEAFATDARTITVGPRETPLAVDKAAGQTTELESFDLFAAASVAPAPDSATRLQADISETIGWLAGLEQRGRRLRAQPATVEVDEFVIVDLTARYAPYRNGQVQGEEQSVVSASLNEADTGPVTFRSDVRYTDATGTFRRSRIATGATGKAEGDPGARIEPADIGQRVVVGPLGPAPTVVYVDATAEDRFGLRADVSAVVPNFSVIAARSWVEEASAVSLPELRKQLEQLDRLSRSEPTSRVLAASGMLRCLVEVFEALDEVPAVPARRVAGAVRLADRVGELVPRRG